MAATPPGVTGTAAPVPRHSQPGWPHVSGTHAETGTMHGPGAATIAGAGRHPCHIPLPLLLQCQRARQGRCWGDWVMEVPCRKGKGGNPAWGSFQEPYPKGVIPLSVIEMARSTKDNKFQVFTSHRIFVFRAENEGRQRPGLGPTSPQGTIPAYLLEPEHPGGSSHPIPKTSGHDEQGDLSPATPAGCSAPCQGEGLRPSPSCLVPSPEE